MNRIIVLTLICTLLIPSVVFADESLTDKLTEGVKEIVQNSADDLEDIVDMVGDIVKYTVEKFSDIKESDWFTQTVSKLVGLGIIDGYPDGTFKPQGNINTDAFIKMTVTALGHEIENGEDYWAENYIEKAKEIGLLENGEFSDYTKPINRAEIARIIVRAMDEDYPIDMDEYITMITDYDSIPNGFKDYVLKAYVKGIVTGYPDGSFGYDKNATRAEASTMLMRMLDEGERKVPEKEEIAKRTTELTEEDIKRLKSYECYKLTGDGKVSKNYKSFEVMYEEEKDECEGIYKAFHPMKYRDFHDNSIYINAEVKFISSPELVYQTPYLDNAIRGITQIKYKTNKNPYNLKDNQWYECDTEYYFRLTTDKHYIRQFKHLSKWKHIE